MKKQYRVLFYSLITTATIYLISFSGSALAGFYDVSGSHVNYDAINYVQEEEIVSGYQDGSYKPDSSINRAEFTKIVVGSQFSQSAIDGCINAATKLFSDVTNDDWYAKYVCIAKKEGIIGGYPDGTFRPANNINFVEAAKIIVNAMSYSVGSDAVWYKPYVSKLDDKNSIPTTITTLDKSITRGEMAEMMYRLLAKVTSKSSMSFDGSSLVSPQSTGAASVTPAVYVGKTDCDDKSTGVSIHKPLCTIQAGLNKIKAGETLLIMNGVYKERVYVPNSGSKGKPIIVKGESEDGVILDAGCPSFPCPMKNVLGSFYYADEDEYVTSGVSIFSQDNITLENFTIRNAPNQGIEARGASGLTIKDMTIKNAVNSLINVYDSFDLTVKDNELSGAHAGKITEEGVTLALTLEEALTAVNTDGFEIANNHLTDGMKEGIVAKVGSKNGKIHNNRVERHCAVGIYIDEASDVDIYENTVSDIGFITKNGKVQRCNDVLSGTFNEQTGEDTYETVNGYGYEIGTGIMLAVGDLGEVLSKGYLSNVRIYKNVVKDVNVGCLRMWDELRENTGNQTGAMQDVQIFNNTFYNCSRSNADWGPGIVLDISAERTKIYNNIFLLMSDSVDDQGVGTDISNNLFYEAGAPAGKNKIEKDPLFTDAENGDFKLKTASPAIDAGKLTDLSYNGDAPDIGAFEY